MEWLSRLLVCVLVVTGISVALLSGCQLSERATPDGGSCSETQIGPLMPFAAQTDADVPLVRLEFAAILVAVFLLVVPTLETAFPRDLRNRSRGGPRQAAFAMRD